MPVKTMNEFFLAELQRLYGEEKRLVGLLPTLGKAATSNELRSMLTDSATQTKAQLKRLEEVFTDLGQKPTAKACPRVEGLCTECETIASLKGDPHVRDVAIIATSQHVLHDEIAGYGCARSWARILGQGNAAALLQTTLEEKKQFDTRFTQAAEKVNQQAMALTS